MQRNAWAYFFNTRDIILEIWISYFSLHIFRYLRVLHLICFNAHFQAKTLLNNLGRISAVLNMWLYTGVSEVLVNIPRSDIRVYAAYKSKCTECPQKTDFTFIPLIMIIDIYFKLQSYVKRKVRNFMSTE